MVDLTPVRMRCKIGTIGLDHQAIKGYCGSCLLYLCGILEGNDTRK